jgi:hypothetical protein
LLTLSDHDFDGAVAQYHNSTGHSAWTPTNPYNQFCISANPLPQTANYSGPSIGPAGTVDDGSSDPSLSVESTGRVYLSRAMGYTTPQAGSATPYAARRTESTNPTGCPPGTVAVFQGPQLIGCVTAKPGNFGGDFDPLHEMIPGAGTNPFGFHNLQPRLPPIVFPKIKLPKLKLPCIPAHAVYIGGETTAIVISADPPIAINIGASLTATNNGSVFFSPQFAIGLPTIGAAGGLLWHLPGQNTDSIMQGASLGISAQHEKVLGAAGFGNDSGVMGGISGGAGTPSLEGTASYGFNLGNNRATANAFCR